MDIKTFIVLFLFVLVFSIILIYYFIIKLKNEDYTGEDEDKEIKEIIEKFKEDFKPWKKPGSSFSSIGSAFETGFKETVDIFEEGIDETVDFGKYVYGEINESDDKVVKPIKDLIKYLVDFKDRIKDINTLITDLSKKFVKINDTF